MIEIRGIPLTTQTPTHPQLAIAMDMHIANAYIKSTWIRIIEHLIVRQIYIHVSV